MKRMEELIHLNKKINFEGKVTEDFFIFFPYYLLIMYILQCFLFSNLFLSFVDLPSNLSVPLAGETR